MPNMIDVAAVALLINKTGLLPESTRSVEVSAWRDASAEVSIHMEPTVTIDELVAMAGLTEPDRLWMLTDTAASMRGHLAIKHEVTVYFPPALAEGLSAAANIPIED